MSKKLTPKQEKFAQNVAKGMKKKEAAKKAGYSENNASRAGTMLSSDANPIVKDRIHQLQTKAATYIRMSIDVCDRMGQFLLSYISQQVKHVYW